MISVQEALALTLQQKADFGTEKVPLLQACGRMLAEDAIADRAIPPFDRVMMDGIAIKAESFGGSGAVFTIENIQAAGQAQLSLKNAVSGCIEVMTGAMLPHDTDAVVPYEACTLENGRARVDAEAVFTGQNIHREASDGQSGDIVLKAGELISAAKIGVLASAGYAGVRVRRLPKVAVCSTGDELVDLAQSPAAHQIRRSNSYMLAAALQKEGIAAEIFHFPDDRDKLAEGISGLKTRYDALLFSGAVSKGKFDFLPGVLHDLGLETIFHSVAQKPGKPFLLGRFADGPLVFGFPGNPVSTFACFQVYFRAWLQHSLGLAQTPEKASLQTGIELTGTLTRFILINLQEENGRTIARPVLNANSGDLGSLAAANGLALFDAGKSQVKTADMVQVIRF